MNANETSKWKVTKALIVLAIPTIIEQILSTLLQYVDTAMVGRLGEKATASVSVTTTINWLIGSICSSIGIALVAMLSRAYGEQNEENLKKTSMLALFWTFLIGIVLMLLAVGLSPVLPIWMGAEKDIQKSATIYFAIISIPMLFRSSSVILGSALRAVKNTKFPMYVNLVANLLNIVLNYTLIYVVGLGGTGAAVGSAISYTVAGILMYVIYRKNIDLSYSMKQFKIDKGRLGESLRIGVPVLATNVVSCLGYVFFAALVSSMGTTIFAAHSIAVSAETLFYIPGYGLRTATSTLVGISLGEKNRKKFELVSYISIFITVLMMCINGGILYFASKYIMLLLTSSMGAAMLGAQMLKLVAFSEPFFGLMVVMEGIFYGLGKTKYVFAVETFSMWGIRILFTAVCIHILHLDLSAVWLCMIADNVFKALLLFFPMLSKKRRNEMMG